MWRYIQYFLKKKSNLMYLETPPLHLIIDKYRSIVIPAGQSGIIESIRFNSVRIQKNSITIKDYRSVILKIRYNTVRHEQYLRLRVSQQMKNLTANQYLRLRYQIIQRRKAFCRSYLQKTYRY